MAAANRTWGAERIRGALLKLNIRVAKSTIQRYIRTSRPPRRSGQTWATFLANHGHQIWAADFLPVTDLLFRHVYAFFIIEIASRRVVHVGVTRHPTDAWVAYNYAMRMGYVSQNVVLAARAPRSEDIERQAWSASEARTFLEASRDSIYWPLWPLLIRCGLRRGEALGLRWIDVDLARHVLTVQQNLVVLDGQRYIKAPKNKGSKQRVVLDLEMVNWLTEHKDAQRKTGKPGGDGRKVPNFVVTTGVGTAVTPDNVTREYDRLIARTNLKRIRVHDLRHTYGTLLHTGGTDLKVISEMLRHSTVSTTGDIYVHADLALQYEAVERLATALRADQ